MGIQGLLPVLKTVTRSVHISAYSGHSVAVDAYCWLHKGAYTCSKEICEEGRADKCISFCMQRVALLQHSNVTPVVVFDGGKLPMKKEEESERHRRRAQNLQAARDHTRAGNASAAYEHYQRAVDITPEVAQQFIKALQKAGVQYIVAPYEADAQMAFLALNNHVHAVITEDSDLLPYGCPRVLFKLDKGGTGDEICMADLPNSRGLSFVGFTPQMFLEMCIMAGCDFVKALPGVGMKKAHSHMRKLKSIDRVCRALRLAGTAVPRTYEADFQRAVYTFRHQRVYNPESRAMEHLRPLPPRGLDPAVLAAPDRAVPPAEGTVQPAESSGQALDFLGPLLPQHLCCQVATGAINPHTLEPFPDRLLHALQPLSLNTAPEKATTQHGKRASAKPLPVQANGISHYFRPCSAPAAKRMRSSSGQLSLPSLLGSQPSQPSQLTQPSGTSQASQPSQPSGSAPQPSSRANPSHPASQGQEQAAAPPHDVLKGWDRHRGPSAPSSFTGFAMRPCPDHTAAACLDPADKQEAGQMQPHSAPAPQKPQASRPAPAGIPAPLHTSSRQQASSPPPVKQPQAQSHKPGSQFAAFRFQPPPTPSALQQQQQKPQGPRRILGANATAMLRRKSASALPSGLHPSLQHQHLQAGLAPPQHPEPCSRAEPSSGPQHHLQPQPWPRAAWQHSQWLPHGGKTAPPADCPSGPASPQLSSPSEHSRGSLECSPIRPPYSQSEDSGASPMAELELELEHIQDTPELDSTLQLSPAPHSPLLQLGQALQSPDSSPAASPGEHAGQLAARTGGSSSSASPAPSQRPFAYDAANCPSPAAPHRSDFRCGAPSAGALRPSVSETSPEEQLVSPARKHPLAWATCRQPRLQHSLLQRRGSAQCLRCGWACAACGIRRTLHMAESSITHIDLMAQSSTGSARCSGSGMSARPLLSKRSRQLGYNTRSHASAQVSTFVRHPLSSMQDVPQPEASPDSSESPDLPQQLTKAGFGSLGHLQSLPSVAAAALARIESSVAF